MKDRKTVVVPRAIQLIPSFVLILALAIAFAIPLTCNKYDTDGYGRYDGTEPSNKVLEVFCAATSNQNKWRTLTVQTLITLLGITLSVACASFGGDALHKLSAQQDGVSVSLAELLLQLPAPATGRGMLQRLLGVLEHESRSHLKPKLLLVAAILFAPLFVSVVGPLATICYKDKNIRFEETRVEVAGLPEWLLTSSNTPNSSLTDYWNPLNASNYVRDKPFRLGLDPSQVKSKLWWTASPVKSKSNHTPSGYHGNSLYQYLSGGSEINRGVASGLQTAIITVPGSLSDKPRNLGIIPLDNVLLTGGDSDVFAEGSQVPAGVDDFTIEQSVLVVDQTCSVYHYKAFEELIKISKKKNLNKYLEENWPKKFLDFTVFSKDDIPFFSDALDGSVHMVWRVLYNDTFDRAYYTANDTKLPLYYKWHWNTTSDGKVWSFNAYTASPYVAIGGALSGTAKTTSTAGMMCKTSLFPIAANVTIPAGFSAVQSIGSNYSRIPFTPASKKLVELAVEYSKQAIDEMGEDQTWYLQSSVRPNITEYNQYDLRWSQFARILPSCRSGNILGRIWKFFPYDNDEAKEPAYGYDEDSCAATEFDRLMKIHMAYLSYIPSDQPAKTWPWGNAQIRFFPNKLYCGAMLGLLLLLAIVIIGLRMVTMPPVEALPDVDLTAPWAPALSRQLSSAGDSEAAKQQGYVMKLDPASGQVQMVPVGTHSEDVVKVDV